MRFCDGLMEDWRGLQTNGGMMWREDIDQFRD
jgi:hypothetical protein